MRSKIKQIMFDWKDGKAIPSGCEFINISGGFTITNYDDPLANWQVQGSSVQWDKVTYRIFNHNNPFPDIETGILLIGEYNT